MGRLQVAIDRGGTFTDVVARTSDGKIITMKLLSEDPEKYKDAPTEAIRRLLKQVIFFNIKEYYFILFIFFYLEFFST
jgi:N-methylhydantoinase A/oxoprolinase/acetone carboxylase beta subunit